MLKGYKIYSILTGACPVCHEESMYKENNPYKLKHIHDMHERCSNCGTKYQIEPSFFYGAMYVSYALGVAIAVATFMITYFYWFGSFYFIYKYNYSSYCIDAGNDEAF